MNKQKLIIFASGSKTGGGSGFQNLVFAMNDRSLNAEIVAVVSNHEHGGVREKADALEIPFIHFPIQSPKTDEELKPTAEAYRKIVADSGAEWVALSGWLKLVVGLDTRRTFNIHPAPLPAFGGPGMYGHYAHEAVMAAYERKEVTHSAVTMHFVGDTRSVADYDRGPIFFQKEVEILPTDDPKSLAARVNAVEHKWQPIVTNRVIHGEILWDGVDPKTLVSPYVK